MVSSLTSHAHLLPHPNPTLILLRILDHPRSIFGLLLLLVHSMYAARKGSSPPPSFVVIIVIGIDWNAQGGRGTYMAPLGSGCSRFWHGGGGNLISFGLSSCSEHSPSCMGENEIVLLLLLLLSSSSSSTSCGMTFEIPGWFSHEKGMFTKE